MSDTPSVADSSDVALTLETVPCNLCGENDAQRLFTEHYCLGERAVRLGINRCARCGLVYVSPRLTLASTRLVYEHDSAQTISHNYCWDSGGDVSRFGPLLTRLAGVAPGGRFLDVGCGGGHLLKEAKQAGRWEVVGVEPVSDAAQQAAAYSGVTVYPTTVEDAPLTEGTFDVITMLGVLEHLHDPSGTLAHVRSLLRPGGVLAVYVPNFHYLRLKDTGLFAWIRTGRWSVLHPQEHLFQYTPRTLTSLLRAQGFDVQRIDVGLPFDHGGPATQRIKRAAFRALSTLHRLSGIHLGGIEAIAAKGSKVVERTKAA